MTGQRRTCPECGAEVFCYSYWREPGEYVPLLSAHSSGCTNMEWGRGTCLVSYLFLDEAADVVRLRAEGGERLRLAAHP